MIIRKLQRELFIKKGSTSNNESSLDHFHTDDNERLMEKIIFKLVPLGTESVLRNLLCI